MLPFHCTTFCKQHIVEKMKFFLFLLFITNHHWFGVTTAQVLQAGTTCRMLTFIPFSDRRDPPPRDLPSSSTMGSTLPQNNSNSSSNPSSYPPPPQSNWTTDGYPPTNGTMTNPGYSPPPNGTMANSGYPPPPNGTIPNSGYPPPPNGTIKNSGYLPPPNGTMPNPAYPPPNGTMSNPGYPPPNGSSSNNQGNPPQRDLSSSPEGEKQKSYGYGTWSDPQSQAKYAFSLMAAAELARHHFNLRDPSLVPELGQLGMCNITMPDPEPHEVLYIDSGYDKISTIREYHDRRFLIFEANGGASNGGGNVNASELVNGRVVSNETKLPTQDRDFCAFIGPVHPYVVSGVSFFAESGRIPLIAYETTSTKFSSQREYPFYASTIPNAADYGEIISKSFRDIWNREGVGVIFDKDDYTDFGVELESPLRNYIETFNHEAIYSPMYQFDDESIHEALEEVKEKGYRTIIVLNDRLGSIEKIAQIADSMSMIGSGYFWLLMGDAFRPSRLRSLRYLVDTPMDKLLSGAALFTNYDRHVYQDDTNPFLEAWRTQKVVSIEKLNLLQPISKENQTFYIANETYFQDEIPAEYASYIYDAVILAGISACNDYLVTFGNESFSHIKELRKTEFSGASGTVRFKQRDHVVEYDGKTKSINQLLSNFRHKSTRDPQDVPFGIYNIRRGEVDENNMQSYQPVLTHLYSYEKLYVGSDLKNEAGVWVAVKNTSFLYFNGTSTEPMPRRDVYDANYLSPGIQIVGLILSITAFVIVITTIVLVYAYQSDKLIKAGQPEFLYLLCFGAALVGLSSFFVIFDESDGLTVEQLSGLCSTFPWFFILGYLLMYCALISKLWRLSKLMQMRRKVVRANQVLFPILMIMGCCLIILTVWQIIDPVQWHREGISDLGQPYETYGECTSVQYGKFPFVIPITVLIAISVGATAVFSYKLRNVQSDLAESSWIFSGIFIHIQTWLVGVPVLYITHGISRDAYILMIVILTFTFATSLVGVVIFPKLFKIMQEKYFGGAKGKTSISIAGGVSRVTGLSGSVDSMSISLPPKFSESIGNSTAYNGNDSTSKKTSDAESDALHLKIIELTMEQESLNVQIAELEETAAQNEDLIQKAAKAEARVAELERLLQANTERLEQAPSKI